MKAYAVYFLFGTHLVLAGCATNGNQFGHGVAQNQSTQSSQLGAGHAPLSENPDAGLSVRDTVETVQDITQTAREAKSTVYEVKQTINELKGLMEGW